MRYSCLDRHGTFWRRREYNKTNCMLSLYKSPRALRLEIPLDRDYFLTPCLRKNTQAITYVHT